MKTCWRILVLIISVAFICSIHSLRVINANSGEFHLDVAQLNDSNLWTQVNSKPYYISSAVDIQCRSPVQSDYDRVRQENPHASTYITVYVNNNGKEAMLSKNPQRFREGAIIVKQKMGIMGSDSKDRSTILYTIMRKREPGYNPKVGDWEFSVVSGDGREQTAVGKLENCQTCHLAKSESDFVFRTYLAPKDDFPWGVNGHSR